MTRTSSRLMPPTWAVLSLTIFTELAWLLSSSAFIIPASKRQACYQGEICNAHKQMESRIKVGRCAQVLNAESDCRSDDKEDDVNGEISKSIREYSKNSDHVQIGQADGQSSVVDQDDQNYAYNNIPRTGYSLADQLENKSPENSERFQTILTPIIVHFNDDDNLNVEIEYDGDGFPSKVRKGDRDDQEENITRHQGVARIDTISSFGNFGEEPVRWLVSLGEDATSGFEVESYAMIDLPPYSDKLVDDIRSFMDPVNNSTDSITFDGSNCAPKAKLSVILLTNQQCIHYDSTPAVYVTRKSDLKKWRNAFPDAQVVMYRLDVPRECREEVTQILDGYGPWGWDECEDRTNAEGISYVENHGNFVETGRPLKIEEWDDDTKTKVLNQGELPPDDQIEEINDQDIGISGVINDDLLYSSDAIRERENHYRLLAVYTPGHTFGSVTYIFPQRGICCSGYTLPLENSGSTIIEDIYDDGDDDSVSTMSSSMPRKQGPRLDYQGYLAMSASRSRQMSSALSLINNYIDRFRVVLPARGDVVWLDSDVMTRKRELLECVGLYHKIGNIYSRLGIVE